MNKCYKFFIKDEICLFQNTDVNLAEHLREGKFIILFNKSQNTYTTVFAQHIAHLRQ